MPCAPNALHALFDLCQTYRALFVHACAGVLGARCLLVRRNCFKMVSASKTVRNGASLSFSLTGHSLQGPFPPPPIMVCLLERAASVRVCVRVNSAVPAGPTVGSP